MEDGRVFSHSGETMNTALVANFLEIGGASIFLILGIFHGVLTWQDLSNPRTFTPPDQNLRLAMQESSIAIDAQTNLWQAWLGFNLSHSLGLVMFGGTFLVIGVFDFGLFAKMLWLQSCALFIAAIYLMLSLKFWFSKPAIGAGLALICFVMAAGLSISI
jgi:hypothetical protein